MIRHAVLRTGLWTLVCAGLGGVLIGFLTDCLRPIAPAVLLPHVHQRLRDRTAVTFVALGDMGEGGEAQTQIAHAMYQVCQQEGCDFVLGLGDNIYPHAVRSVDDLQFQEKFERPYALFQQMDFWMILGNHDWKRLRRGAQAEVDYTLRSPRWRLPNSHYAIPMLPPWLHLYGVDTRLLEATVDLHQLRAARAALCQQPGWRFLFGHYPTYANGSAGQHGQWFVRRQLEHLIHQCHVQVYFAGHVHHQAHLNFGFYQEIIQGAGGAELTTVQPGDPQQRFGAAMHGFAWVQATAERLVVRFYDVQQTVLYTWCAWLHEMA
jgi:tartrate-resistant acid phosphatase type 5